MAYCRWSSNGFKCDVYVYEDVNGGYTCHVAGLKIVNGDEAPFCPDLIDYPRDEEGKITDEAVEDFMVKHRAYMDWLEKNAIRKPIGLGFDGKSFNVETATSMGNELKLLQNMGYNVPDYVIEALWEEGKENGEQPDEEWLR